jgi:hypothetical protein
MKNRSLFFVCFFLSLLCNTLTVSADSNYQTGDTVTLGTKKFRLLSNNLITNPGFQNGLTGWTDATSSAAALTTAKFSIRTTGGVDNSAYLVGTTNENASSSGSIGTGWALTKGTRYLFAFKVKYLDATAVAGTEAYLKTSLTNTFPSSPNEPSVLISSAQVNSGGAWTQNHVFFTNGGTYNKHLVVRFRWLDNRFGFDDFWLFEAEEVVNNDALQATISEAQALYKGDAVGAATLLEAITTAQGFLTSSSVTEVEAATAALEKAIQTYRYANTTPENPLDMTSFLKNPSFADNTATGWQGAGTINYQEVEFYEKTFNMYQTISGLPAGKYRLKAQGFERPKANDGGAAYRAGTETIYARLYAASTGYTELTSPFNSLYQHSYTGSGSTNGYINTMAAANTAMASGANYQMTLTDILLNEGGSLTLGAKSTFQQAGYWVLFDNFRLEYLGGITLSDLATALANRATEANGLLVNRMQLTVTEALNAAIALAQQAAAAQPLVEADVQTAKDSLDLAIATANTSIQAYAKLLKAINHANTILGFLEKTTEINTLQDAIDVANGHYENLGLTLAQLNAATASLTTTTRNVGKKIYVPTWMMGDVYNPSNNWSIERSRQSKNWILFWEPGFGENPGAEIDQCLALAEKAFTFYADSLKFIKKGASKTDTYKMIIRYRYSTEWEATGSGVDHTIGLLTLTNWAMTSRGGQTVAHEVGHCFQYQVHCDNNNNNGWMYGFGTNGDGGNGFWEQCAQWQAYKVFPEQQFTNEWFSGYLSRVHKHLLHETPRYENYFIQDFWTYKRGMDVIGKLWNQSYYPEDPIETYKRLYSLTQTAFNDEIWECAARFATWDIPALKALGASKVSTRPQPKLNNQGSYVWRIDPTVCLENYGHNIIRVNAPYTAKTVTAYFEGLAGAEGYRSNYKAMAGWRYGFVALLNTGERVYGPMKAVTKSGVKDTLTFDCPSGCSRLWLVVTGAPSTHWRHAWDDDDTNDEQWPYQVSFTNSNLYGYTNIVGLSEQPTLPGVELYTSGSALFVRGLNDPADIVVRNLSGQVICTQQTTVSDLTIELAAGFYLVTIRTTAGELTRKVVVH